MFNDSIDLKVSKFMHAISDRLKIVKASCQPIIKYFLI